MADRDACDLVPRGGGGFGAGAPDPLLRRARLPMNDVGNARRFAEHAAGRLLFCAEIGRSGAWLWFDGSRWSASDGDARARAAALYRRVMGISAPLYEAAMPAITGERRERAATIAGKRMRRVAAELAMPKLTGPAMGLRLPGQQEQTRGGSPQ